MENIPVQSPPAAAGWKPSTATVGGGVIGGALTQVVVFTLSKFGIELDAATTGALATLLTVGVVYLFPTSGGRS